MEIKNITPESFKSKFAFLSNFKFLLVLYFFISIGAGIGQILKTRPEDKDSRYNNYLIFKSSYTHLIHNQDLYQLWPREHFDYYKYSPTFAFLMAPFSWVPEKAGLLLWDLLNGLTLFFAIKFLPKIDERKKVFTLWFISLELLTSLQNSQSNGLMAALMIGAFICMENKKMFLATLLIALSAYIKIFSLVMFAMMLLYPQRIKSIIYSGIALVILGLIPLVAISFDQLKFLYQSWIYLLQQDHSDSLGLSILGWLQTWFHLDPDKSLVLIAGAILFMIPFVLIKKYEQFNFRLLLLASVLLWVIIFNHKAESPTFVVAMAGVAIWFTMEKRNQFDILLIVLAFLFTSVSPTDIFPLTWRESFVVPFVLKGVPCIFIWMKIMYELLTVKYDRSIE